MKKKIAIIGDSFLDEYVIGEVNRISPEAPVPVLDVTRHEQRGGGAMNVANNLHGLGVEFTLFTIFPTSMQVPYRVISPKGCTVLRKTRYVGNANQQIVRVDSPKVYRKEDIKKMMYPNFENFDIVAFADYDKGIVKGGKATIVDSKKKDLSVFDGSEYLKVNAGEFNNCIGSDVFSKAFITNGQKGIDYYEHGELQQNSPTQTKEVIDVGGAGDTVLATMIYCLAHDITDPKNMMDIANKAAGIVISRFGTSAITLKELNL